MTLYHHSVAVTVRLKMAEKDELIEETHWKQRTAGLDMSNIYLPFVDK